MGIEMRNHMTKKFRPIGNSESRLRFRSSVAWLVNNCAALKVHLNQLQYSPVIATQVNLELRPGTLATKFPFTPKQAEVSFPIRESGQPICKSIPINSDWKLRNRIS